MTLQPERPSWRRVRNWRRGAAGAVGAILAGIVGSALAGALEDGQRIAVGAPPHQERACMNCHGIAGMGDAASGFPRLAGIDAAYLARQLAAYAEGTRDDAVMAPIARALTPDERVSISRYYQSLPSTSRAATIDPAPDPLLLQHGARLWALGVPGKIQACVSCHGGAALPGRGAVYPAAAGQPAAYVIAQFRAWRAGARSNDPYGMMRAVATALDERDVEAVALYLATLPPR